MSALFGLTSTTSPLLATTTTNLVVMSRYDRNVIQAETATSGISDVLLLAKPRLTPSLLDSPHHTSSYRIFYPDWGQQGYTVSLAEVRELDPVDVSDPRAALARLGSSAPHGQTPRGNFIPIPYGRVMQIGALSVASLISDRLGSSSVNYTPPWVRDVDILLLSGLLTQPNALTTYIKELRGPGPLLAFYPRIAGYDTDCKSWNTWPSYTIGLGPSTSYHARVRYQVNESKTATPSGDRLDLSVHSSPMRKPSRWASTTKTREKHYELVNKERRFSTILQFRYKSEVSNRLADRLSRTESPLVARARSSYASNQTTRFVAKYLAFLERHPGHTQAHRRDLLTQLYDEMHAPAVSSWQNSNVTHDVDILRTVPSNQFPADWVQAFSLYLQLWYYENTSEQGPYR